MLTQDTLIHSLRSPAMDRALRECVDSIAEIPEPLRAECLGQAYTWRDQIVRVIAAIDDPEELRSTAATQYIELKCHFIKLNTANSYYAYRTGRTDDRNTLMCGLVSTILAEIERQLDAEDIGRITDFLAAPLRA